jgi:putative DNA methylase
MAIVAESSSGRAFLSPSAEHAEVLETIPPADVPDTDLPAQGLGFRVQRYGMTKHRQLFTRRQRVALATFADLLREVCDKAEQEGQHGEASPADRCMARAYACAIATYLAFSISKAADLASSLCHWQPNPEHLKLAPTFARPTLSMTWDYAEGNPFSDSSGNFGRQPELIAKALSCLFPTVVAGKVRQCNAQSAEGHTGRPIISTDPPYYDNIGYADLSDFFYIWLRRALATIYPELFNTLLVPKREELIADPGRHGGREESKKFFEQGLNRTFEGLRIG